MMLIDAEQIQKVENVTGETAYVLARLINAQSRMIEIAGVEHASDEQVDNAMKAIEMLDKRIYELSHKIESVYEADGVSTVEEMWFDVIDEAANTSVEDDDFDYLLDEDSDDDDDVSDVWFDALDMPKPCLTFDDFI